MITVGQLIENARVRHPAFMKVQMPDGAILLFLNQYQRMKLLELGAEIEPLVGEARQVASVISGSLIGSDEGVPYFITTSGDGWPVGSEDGVPYVDFTDVPIALDPFGESGSTPGFPLPSEFIKLIDVTAATLYSAALPVDVVPESRRNAGARRDLACFVSGNRLVPIRQGAAPFTDAWQDVLSVSVSYVAMQSLAAKSDVITLPLSLVSLLEAALAERFAFAAPAAEMSDAVRRTFTADRVAAEESVAAAAGEILGETTTSHVQFNG